MSSHRLTLLLGALLLGSAQARAELLFLSVEQSFDYQSNLFNSAGDAESDGAYELRPTIRLLRRHPVLQHELFYQPSFAAYASNSEQNSVDHRLRGLLSFAPTPRGEVTLRADVHNYRAVSSASVEDDGVPDVLVGADGRVTRAFGDLGFEQRLRPDWIADARFGVRSYTFTEATNVESLGFDGDVGLLHELRSNFALGASIFASQRSFEGDVVRRLPESRNVVLLGALVLRAEPSRTIFIELRAGPAWVSTSQDSPAPALVNRFAGSETAAGTEAAVFDPSACPELMGEPLLGGCPRAAAPALAGRLGETVRVDFAPGGRPEPRDESRVTGFARALVRKEDSWGFASLAYSRWEEASAGIRSSTVRDSLTATLQLRLAPHWELRLRGNANRRQALDAGDDVVVRAGPSAVPTGTGLFFAEANGLVSAEGERTRITQYWADLLVTRSLWDDRLSVELGFRYLFQESAARLSTDFHNYSGSLAVRYDFRPIRVFE